MTMTMNDCISRISQLREEGLKNDELIRRAIRLIFFELNETPSQRKILLIVGAKGQSPSAGTVQKHLNEFWADIKSRMRVDLARPDIPAGMLDAAGELLSQMWTLASGEAAKSLEVFREASIQESREYRIKADLDVAQARSAAETLSQQMALVRSDLENTRQENASLEQARSEAVTRSDLAESRYQDSLEKIRTLSAELQEAGKENERFRHEHNERIKEIQREHEHSLDKLRAEAETRTKELIAEHANQSALLNKEIAGLNKALGLQEEQLAHLKLIRDHEVSSNRRLQEELDKAHDQISVYAREIHDLQLRLGDAITAHAQVKAKYDLISDIKQLGLVNPPKPSAKKPTKTKSPN